MIITLILIFFKIFLLIFSAEAINAARDGLEIWLINVIPSLFPFMVATNIISQTFVIKSYQNRNRFLKKFNIRNEIMIPIIIGFTAGAPLSSKLIADFIKSNKITLTEAQRLLSFCSNMGIIFILGVIASTLNDLRIAKIILMVHYSSAIINGFIFKFYKYRDKTKIENMTFYKNNTRDITQNISTIFKESITTSVKSIVIIGGYIIFFSVVIELLVVSEIAYHISVITEYENSEPLIYGIIEVTTALEYTNSPLIISTILSFSGISIISQSIAFLEQTKVNLKIFIASKISHALIAFLLGSLIF